MWQHAAKKPFPISSVQIRWDSRRTMQRIPGGVTVQPLGGCEGGGVGTLSKSHFKIRFEMGWLLNCCNRRFSGSRVAQRR